MIEETINDQSNGNEKRRRTLLALLKPGDVIEMDEGYVIVRDVGTLVSGDYIPFNKLSKISISLDRLAAMDPGVGYLQKILAAQ